MGREVGITQEFSFRLLTFAFQEQILNGPHRWVKPGGDVQAGNVALSSVMLLTAMGLAKITKLGDYS